METAAIKAKLADQKTESAAPGMVIRPTASTAAHGRHRGLFISFAVFVFLPIILMAGYLYFIAQNRYTSTIGFTVRSGSNENSAASLLGGLAGVTGGSVSGDSDILNQFIRSQQMVQAVDEKLDLRRIYGAYWSRDPIFALKPDASIEQLVDYWSRIVTVFYDQSSGLIQVEVNSFSPDVAQKISAEILSQSQILVNAINEDARKDAIRYAQLELSTSEERLKKARTALTNFRTRTKIVDVQADIQTRMGVLAALQQQLSQEQVGLKDLLTSTRPSDPRIAQAQRRIDAINARIDAQRDELAQAGGQFSPVDQTGGANGPVVPNGETISSEVGDAGIVSNPGYPEAISQYEALQADLEFAQKAYMASLAALDAARMAAMQQNRYLAAYITPTMAQQAIYPKRFEIVALAALFLTLIWGIGALIYYSVREHA